MRTKKEEEKIFPFSSPNPAFKWMITPVSTRFSLQNSITCKGPRFPFNLLMASLPLIHLMDSQSISSRSPSCVEDWSRCTLLSISSSLILSLFFLLLFVHSSYHHLFILLLLLDRNTEEYQIVGFPVGIEGKKYPRNGLLFNMGFVFDLDANIKSFEPLVRKVANIMQSLEVWKDSFSLFY